MKKNNPDRIDDYLRHSDIVRLLDRSMFSPLIEEDRRNAALIAMMAYMPHKINSILDIKVDRFIQIILLDDRNFLTGYSMKEFNKKVLIKYIKPNILATNKDIFLMERIVGFLHRDIKPLAEKKLWNYKVFRDMRSKDEGKNKTALKKTTVNKMLQKYKLKAGITKSVNTHQLYLYGVCSSCDGDKNELKKYFGYYRCRELKPYVDLLYGGF